MRRSTINKDPSRRPRGGAYIYAVLAILDLKVFLFQRTIRKVGINYGVPMKVRGFYYPMIYMVIHIVAYLKWVAIITMCCYGYWWCAVICVLSNWLITMIWPEGSDYKHIQKARKAVNQNIPKGEELNAMLIVCLDKAEEAILNNGGRPIV